MPWWSLRQRMCLPTLQECSEDDCDRYAMRGTTLCFGHADMDAIRIR